MAPEAPVYHGADTCYQDRVASEKQRARNSSVPLHRTLIASLVLLLLGAALVTLIFSTEPTASREGATKKTEMVVDVIAVERGRFHPEIVAVGTVTAEQDVVVAPRVQGQVVWLSPQLQPGKLVKVGTPLARLDPADYHNALQQRRSELQQAVTALDLEKGRVAVAKREVDM